ncbi:MAG: YqgE/AlgH family protein, partial [Methylophilaceae bacterium]|nr:YqgE/AlgH family protein [Methylophilaceae bacterium]
LVTLGYAGWGAGQLEQEMAQNAWLTVKPSDIQSQDKVIFDIPNEEKFTAAIGLLGIDLAKLSEEAGHA